MKDKRKNFLECIRLYNLSFFIINKPGAHTHTQITLMSQSTSNNSFKEILSAASNNYLKKPLTDTLNSLSNMASYSGPLSSSSSSSNATKNDNQQENNNNSSSKYKSTNSNNSTTNSNNNVAYQIQSSSITSTSYFNNSTGSGASNGGVASNHHLVSDESDTKTLKNKIDQLDFLSTVGTGTFG